MTLFDSVLDRVGQLIAQRLERPLSGYQPYTPSDPETMRRVLEPADVVLIEGNQKVSAAIKYLTQSTWSHAALYVGDALGRDCGSGRCMLIEANLGQGVVAVPLSKYASFNTRICRPIGLAEEEQQQVIAFAIDHLGDKYDTRNVVDLVRYLLPTPPVPVRWRRRMLALGSGEPTRVICSTLIAKAFQSIRYPILPGVERVPEEQWGESAFSRREIFHIRHHSLFAPRDFDLSPYFRVVKPTIEAGFDHRRLNWADGKAKAATSGHQVRLAG